MSAVPSTKQQLVAHTVSAVTQLYPPHAAPPLSDGEAPRTILAEVVYAILRDDATPDQADAAFAAVKAHFVDWNEIRVSTILELSEVLAPLPNASDRARRVIEFLQEHFERTYSFDLDDLEKKGLKQAVKQLARYKDTGVADFAVAWVAQRALKGHSIPLDGGAIRVLSRLGILDGDLDDLESVRASLEHYIPKARGPEFTDALSRFAAEICVPGVPHCPSCPLKAECPTGQKLLAEGKARAK